MWPWSTVSLLIVWSTMVWVLTKRFESFVAAVARYGPLELDSQFAEVQEILGLQLLQGKLGVSVLLPRRQES